MPSATPPKIQRAPFAGTVGGNRMAGVIDKHVDRAPVERGHHRRDGVGGRQIDGDIARRNAVVGRQLRREVGQPRRAPGDEHHIMARSRQLPRKLGSEARRGAGDGR